MISLILLRGWSLTPTEHPERLDRQTFDFWSWVQSLNSLSPSTIRFVYIRKKTWIPKQSERKNSLPCRTKVKYTSLHMLHIYFKHELFDMSSIIWTVWKVSNFHWKLNFFDLLVSLLQILSSFHIYKMNSNNWVLEAWVWSKLVSLMNQYTQN